MADQHMPAKRTVVTMPDYVRSAVRCWPLVGDGIPLEESIAVLWAQYMIETGGRSCYNWNIGNAKYVKGSGFDYHMLHGVWEGVSPAAAEKLVASGQAVLDTNASHIKAVGTGRVSIVFQPPHPATWFRAYATLDAGMATHLKLLARRFAKSWPALLRGDVDEFAVLLRSQGYFTASAEAYAAGMHGPFKALVATSTYEELVATPREPVESVPEEMEEKAVLWDRDTELENLVSVMHRGASGLILEDLLRSRLSEDE